MTPSVRTRRPASARDAGARAVARSTRDGREPRRRSIVFAVTHDASLALLSGYPQHLAASGWEVHVVSAPGPRLEALRRGAPELAVHAIPMRRDPSPMHDLRSLLAAVRLLRRIRPSVVSAGTPKAGMLVTLAALAAGVPVRIHHQRGLPWETATGARRALLAVTERVTGAAATTVLCVSPSLRRVLVHNRLVAARKVVVVGQGSSNGVDLVRFSPRRRSADASGAVAVGFVGRLARDKGCDDLVAAMLLLRARGSAPRLVVAGAVEDPESHASLERLRDAGATVELLGHVDDMRLVYDSFDVLCLPTRREGFPNVVLEAAACAVPTVTTTATGAIDSVVDGETGRCVPVGDVRALADALEELCTDGVKRVTMGVCARARVEQHFARPHVWHRLDDLYASLAAR